MTRQQLIDYIEDEYNIKEDYPFEEDFVSAVFRHKENKKWFALLMQVPGRKLGENTEEKIDILNVKCDPILRSALLRNKGVRVAYHMNKVHWLTIILEKADEQIIKTLVDCSYELTLKK